MKKVDKLFVFAVSFLLWYLYLRFNIFQYPKEFEKVIVEYKNNLLPSPLKYRILIPEIIVQLCKLNINTIQSFTIILYFTFYFSILQLYKFFEICFIENKSKLAVLLSSIFIIATYPDHIYQPWSYLDIGLYSMTYYLVLGYNQKFKFIKLFIISIIAVLNRETGIFIPIYILIHNILYKEKLSIFIKTFFLVFVSLLTLFLIRKYKGYEISSDSSRIIPILEFNLKFKNLRNYVITLIAIGLPFLKPSKEILNRFKEIFILLFLFFPLYIIFGNWVEIRMLLPFLPLYALILINKLKFN